MSASKIGLSREEYVYYEDFMYFLRMRESDIRNKKPYNYNDGSSLTSNSNGYYDSPDLDIANKVKFMVVEEELRLISYIIREFENRRKSITKK